MDAGDHQGENHGRSPIRHPKATKKAEVDPPSPAIGNIGRTPLAGLQCQNHFKVGNLKNCLAAWQNIPSDKLILSTIWGYKIEFDKHSVQFKVPCQIEFTASEHQ